MAESEQDGALIEAMARAGYGAVAIPDDDIEWDDLTDDDRALLICTFRAALAVARPVIAAETRDAAEGALDSACADYPAPGSARATPTTDAAYWAMHRAADLIADLPLSEETS